MTRSHPQPFLAEMGPEISPEEPKASKVILLEVGSLKN